MAIELVETVEVGVSGVTTIEFTSIPQDATHLMVQLSGKSSYAQNYGGFKFTLNNDTSANYDWRDLIAYATGIYGQAGTGDPDFQPELFAITGSSSSVTNTWGNATIFLSNYTSTDDKNVSVDAGFSQDSTSRNIGIFAGRLATSSPITSIQLNNRSGETYVQYSTASLYKIY